MTKNRTLCPQRGNITSSRPRGHFRTRAVHRKAAHSGRLFFCRNTEPETSLQEHRNSGVDRRITQPTKVASCGPFKNDGFFHATYQCDIKSRAKYSNRHCRFSVPSSQANDAVNKTNIFLSIIVGGGIRSRSRGRGHNGSKINHSTSKSWSPSMVSYAAHSTIVSSSTQTTDSRSRLEKQRSRCRVPHQAGEPSPS